MDGGLVGLHTGYLESTRGNESPTASSKNYTSQTVQIKLCGNLLRRASIRRCVRILQPEEVPYTIPEFDRESRTTIFAIILINPRSIEAQFPIHVPFDSP